MIVSFNTPLLYLTIGLSFSFKNLECYTLGNTHTYLDYKKRWLYYGKRLY